MLKDAELQTVFDYSEGQIKAAHRVLIELANILKTYENDFRIVGGWVPDLLFPGQGHVGSIDVDILLNHLKLKESSYETVERILKKWL